MEINCNYVLIKRKNNYKILDSTLFPMFDSNWKNLEDFSHLNEVYYISSDGTTKYCTVIAVNRKLIFVILSICYLICYKLLYT